MSAAAKQDDVLVPYSDVHAEGAVLAAVILDPEALPKIVDFLKPEHFYAERHRRIYEACCDLFASKEPVDEQTIASWLKARDRLRQVGGLGYIAEVANASPDVAHVRAHALAVHDAWRRRQMMRVCQRIVIQSATSVDDVQSWCEESVRALGEIVLDNPIKPIETSEQALARVLADALLEDGAPPVPGTVSLTGFPIGLPGLDRVLGGLRKSAKTTVAATTGVGKTAFAVQCMVSLAKQGVGVLMFSKELKRTEIMRRALLQESGVSANRIRDRRLTKADRQALIDAKARLEKLPIIIDDTPRLTIEQLASVAKAKREDMLRQFRVPLGMIIDDYVQRSDPSRHLMQRDRHEQLEWHTKGFKTLCQELDVVGLELAQQKDPVPGRKPQMPRGGAEIADSSKIGKEADDIIYLIPDAAASPGDPRVPVDAWIAKNRAGPKNLSVPLVYRGDTYTFTDPNAPGAMPSRQYAAQVPMDDGQPYIPEHPPGRFDDDEDDNPLTRGL